MDDAILALEIVAARIGHDFVQSQVTFQRLWPIFGSADHLDLHRCSLDLVI